jgi:hypothetical protein
VSPLNLKKNFYTEIFFKKQKNREFTEFTEIIKNKPRIKNLPKFSKKKPRDLGKLPRIPITVKDQNNLNFKNFKFFL